MPELELVVLYQERCGFCGYTRYLSKREYEERLLKPSKVCYACDSSKIEWLAHKNKRGATLAGHDPHKE